MLSIFYILNYLLLGFIVLAPVVYFCFVLYYFKKYFTDSKFILLIFAVFVIAYFNKLLFRGQALAQQDFNNIQYPFFKFFHDSITLYKLPPIWNSLTGGGFDAFSNPLANYFNPFLWIFAIIKDTFFATNLFLSLHVFFTLLFGFVYFRVLKLSRGAAFVGAILLTFNAFLAMRLSPGVGVEYIFTLKWIVAALAFTHLYFEQKKRVFLILLAIALAFMFEGNMNIAIAGGLFWFIYSLFICRKQFFKLVPVPFLAFLIFSVKLLPGMFLIATADGRISEVASGWRVEKIHALKLPIYLLPLKQAFPAPAFTPGLVGGIFLIVALICVMALLIHKRLGAYQRLGIAAYGLLATGAILVTYNPISSLVFKLPIFNRLTILPAFIIFLLIPLGIMGTLLAEHILKSKSWGLVIVLLPFVIYAEVLLGPATLGDSTYSFNFLKMNYANEMHKLAYYEQENTTNKLVMVLDDYGLLTFPGHNAYHNSYFLNNFKYLFGSTPTNKWALQENLAEVSKYADVFIAPREVPKEANKLTALFVPRFDENVFVNYAVLDRVYDYEQMHISGWGGEVTVYEPMQKQTQSVKKTDMNPLEYKFKVRANNYEKNGTVITSMTYSPFWKVSKSSATTEKGPHGYLSLKGLRVDENITLTYKNPFIYLGFGLSFGAFIYITIELTKKRHEI